MNWYKVGENDAYKRMTDKLFIVAKHRVSGGIKYYVARPVFRWKDWWWQDINDNTFLHMYEDDRYFIFSPLSF